MVKVESYKKGIILSTGFNIFNKGLVFLNGLLVAYFFGVQTGTDIFFYVYNSVLILGAFVTSINGTVIIPESMRIRTQDNEKKAMAFLNFFLYLYGSIIFMAIAVVFLNPAKFFSTVSNFQLSDLSTNRSLLLLSLPLFGMICIINLLTDILTSHKFFTAPMIVGIINGIFSITFMLTLHSMLGIKSALYGLLTSYCLNIFLLMYVLRRFLKWKFRYVSIMRDKRIWKNLGFAQLGNFTSTAASYTPMYILSGFNTGIITALTFAQQISSLPTALITTQFSSVAGIKFNELYAIRNTKEINRIFTEAADFLHFIMVPVSCFIFYFSTEIVQFLLGFTSINPNAASYVSLFLRFLGFLLPLYVINNLISRLFMASHKIKESFWYQILFNIILIPALFLAVHSLGVIGYPIAIVSAYALNLLASFFIEKHYFNFISYKNIILTLGWIIGANAIISTGIYLIVLNMPGMQPILKLATAFFLYSTILLLLNNKFKFNIALNEQVGTIQNMLKKKA